MLTLYLAPEEDLGRSRYFSQEEHRFRRETREAQRQTEARRRLDMGSPRRIPSKEII